MTEDTTDRRPSDPTVEPLLVLFGGAGRERIVERLIEDGRQIGAIVAPPPGRDRLDAAIATLEGRGVPVVRTTKADVAATLQGRPEPTLLSIGFPYLLAPDVLARFRHALNVHPTLLPKYRGPTTAAYIIMDGAPEAGSTVHLLDAGMDTGPIVAQRSIRLDRFDTLRSMQRAVYGIEPDLVAEALDRLATPGFTATAQDESQASVFPRPRRPEDSRIDPTRPLAELYDTIRACDPDDFPAFFEVDGQRVAIRLWRPDRPEGDRDPDRL